MKLRVLVPLLVICVSSFLDAPGQNTTGTITGRLTDPTGAVIAGARVSVRNPIKANCPQIKIIEVSVNRISRDSRAICTISSSIARSEIRSPCSSRGSR